MMSADNDNINNGLPRAPVLVDANVHNHNTTRTIHSSSVASDLDTINEEQDEDGYPTETIDIERCIISVGRQRSQAAKRQENRAWWRLEPGDMYYGDEELPCGFFLCLIFGLLAAFTVGGLVAYVAIQPSLEPTMAPSAAVPASPIYEMQLGFPAYNIPDIHFQHARVYTPQDGIEMEQDCRMACSEAVAFVFITELSLEVKNTDTDAAIGEINCICYLENSFSLCNHSNSDIPFRSALLRSTVPLPEEGC